MLQIHDENEIKSDLVEAKNGYFKQLIPWFENWHAEYSYYAGNGYYDYNEEIFDFAHNGTCSCAMGLIDSTIETENFKIKRKLEFNLNGQPWPCNDDMEETECHYKLRQHDTFDLFIENVAKDACIVCYGVGPNLWPIPKDQLMSTLTRSEGDKLIHYDDCSPKPGYHKSRFNEVYRCEGGDDKVGVMAFTEANGNTDYYCGFRDSRTNADYVFDHWYPIFSVSFFFI